MTFSTLTTDLLYLALYALADIVKMAGGLLIVLSFLEGLVHTAQLLRR